MALQNLLTYLSKLKIQLGKLSILFRIIPVGNIYRGRSLNIYDIGFWDILANEITYCVITIS